MMMRWRVTKRFYMFGLMFPPPSVTVKVYRWHWRARLVSAMRYAGILGFETVTVEPFYPDVERHFAFDRLAALDLGQEAA